MGGPLGILKTPEKPPQGYLSKGARITNISAQVTFLCTCGGYNLPLVIHVIPGLDSQPTCPACRTKYRLKKWHMDQGVEIQLNLDVEAIQPSIVRPV